MARLRHSRPSAFGHSALPQTPVTIYSSPVRAPCAMGSPHPDELEHALDAAHALGATRRRALPLARRTTRPRPTQTTPRPPTTRRRRAVSVRPRSML